MLEFLAKQLDVVVPDEVKDCINFLELRFRERWNVVYRVKARFVGKYEQWLNSAFKFNTQTICQEQRVEKVQEIEENKAREAKDFREQSTSAGRKRVLFEEASDRSKRRAVHDLIEKESPLKIAKAAKIIQSASNTALEKCLTVEDALALYFDLHLIVSKYKLLRSCVNAFHNDLFPSYKSLATLKQKLMPNPIIVTESSVEVPLLQALLDSTAKSLISRVDLKENASVTLECKWGFEGSSDHSLYKQKFAEEGRTDEFMKVSAPVPLSIRDANKIKIGLRWLAYVHLLKS